MRSHAPNARCRMKHTLTIVMCPNLDGLHGLDNKFHITHATMLKARLRLETKTIKVEEDEKEVEKQIYVWVATKHRRHTWIERPSDQMLLRILEDTQADLIETWQTCARCRRSGIKPVQSPNREDFDVLSDKALGLTELFRET